MKKVLKIIAVSIASLLAILLITIGVLSRVIFYTREVDGLLYAI